MYADENVGGFEPLKPPLIHEIRAWVLLTIVYSGVFRFFCQ